MSEQLKHIFDISKCPTKRQMQDYLDGTMQPEEIYAFEHHISSCILCSEAMDGMMENKEMALAGMSELNDTFLKDHLELHPPHIHLNGIAATPTADTEDKKTKTINVWRPAGIAAALLLCLGLGWYFKNTPSRIAEHTPIVAHAKEDKNGSTQPLPESEATDKHTAPSEINKLVEPPKTNDITSPQPAPEFNDVTQVTPALQNEQPAVKEPQAGGMVERAEKEDLRKAADSKQESAPKEPINYKMINANDVASLSGGTYQQKTGNEVSIGGARSNGTVYVIDGIQTDKSDTKKNVGDNGMNDADVLFEKGEYSQALAGYKKQMNGSDVKSSDQAKLMAARCYLNLGQKKNALKLLSELAEEGRGAPKRQAKKLLRETEREE